jgi:hypothetical protein
VKASVLEYLNAVVRTWWARVSVLAGAAGLASELTNLVLPSAFWWALVGAAAVLAQFAAFHHVRTEREQLREATRADEASPQAVTFVPHLFEGRLFPNSFYMSIDGSERAFVIRAARAFAMEGEYEELGSESQKLFEDAVASSAFEGWMQRQMNTIRAAPSSQWWKRIQPTRNQIVTVGRPTAPLPHYDFTLSGHGVINFNQGMVPGHPGHGELVASAIFRPASAAEDGAPGVPLSLEDLYEAITCIEAAIVDQIGPTMASRVTRAALRPKSFAVLAIANGGSVSDYVGIEQRHWPRAAGSHDENALWGCAASEATLSDPAERDREIRGWIVRFLRNGGYSDFESDIDRLATPNLPVPLPAG